MMATKVASLSLLTIVWGVSSAGAAVVEQLNTMPVGTSWSTSSYWDWPAAGLPSGSYAGNDFVTPAGMTVRTPDTGGSTFPGQSLTVAGTLALKSVNNASRTNTVNDLRLDGASIANFTSGANTTQTIAGETTVLGNSEVYSTSTSEDRHVRLIAKVGGAARLNHRAARSGNTASYWHPDSTFSGVWRVERGNLVFGDAGAVGKGRIEVAGISTSGTLEVRADWNTPGSSLTVTGGTVKLGAYTWTVTTLTLGTTPLSHGTYTATDLNSYGTGTFTGSGTVVVRPPGTVVSLR